MDERALIGWIGELYEAVLEPERLCALEEKIWRGFGCESGSMHVVALPSREIVLPIAASENFDALAQREYREHYHARNLWAQRSSSRSPPFVVRGHDVVEDAVFARSEFGGEWCARAGVFHLLGALHPLREGVGLATAIYRPRRKGRFSVQDQARFALVTEHACRAVQIADRVGALTNRQRFCLEILEGLDLGLALLTAEARPVFFNSIAERVVRRSRWFLGSGGRLRPIRGPEARRFERLVAEVARTSSGGGLASGGLLCLSDADGTVLPLLIAPIRLPWDGMGAAEARVLVLFADPDATRALDPRKVAAAFGLTRTEGAVVAALASGKSLAGYAAEAGVSINTAKRQLAMIFDKTGHCRQATLVAAAVTLPMVRTGRDVPLDTL